VCFRLSLPQIEAEMTCGRPLRRRSRLSMREGALRRRRLAHQLLDLAARVARLPLRLLAAAVLEIAGADTSISDEREGSVLAVTGESIAIR